MSADSDSQWTSGQYPDLRGPTVVKCASVLPQNKQHMYICDPDRVLNNSQVTKLDEVTVVDVSVIFTSAEPQIELSVYQPISLNRQLHDLAVGTPCHCQRRSQCTTGLPGTGTEGFHGFVVSVAIVKNLQMQMHSPSEA
ncbi:hypothetical protein DICVIV_02450 [Dictyocaulus viviparus]|uniref:Uncharacterized protein n=1 Tax=Dictyocaulus viviparus TaxID=29172 RepID=A0A0D8Y5S4_DICVI|nr:hypothetical protein DICVIV_02450 [Dictyocaulus viviparus]